MATRITNKIFIGATVLASLFTLFFGIYEYQREHAFRADILHSLLQLNNYRWLEGSSDTTIRVTVTDTLGNVLSDSEEKDITHMGNHLQREEIQKALKHGSGYAIKRASETNGEKYFYSATRFDDRIVRSSVPYSAELTSSLTRDYTFFYYTVGIFVLIAIAVYFRYRYEHSEREKQRIKRQLTENAAHELKTPAATIEGYLETLVSNASMPQDKRQEFLERCYAQSRRMSSLLADMSTLTRLDEAHITRPQTQIDAAVILRQIASETGSQFSQEGIQLQLSIPESMPMTGDASLIYSMFHNIFSNTLAYATEATYFKVQARVWADRYQFTFIDNGAGVPATHLSHIFERFYRIDKGRSRRLGGTGLGLAIVKNIALQYGGIATASITPGGGLTISIEVRKET
ncbi:MAG: HAMP domain-containing histidine kinase [Bacteroidaceae bacterium]|nr:HAMP domain-containing histidine kinase [Bacteroidaceae bacterium]